MSRTAPSTAPDGAVERRVLELLRTVTGDAEVLADPDLPLYESGLLDSLGTVTLMVEIEEAFGVTISPAEFDRQAWATPRSLVDDVERRLLRAKAG